MLISLCKFIPSSYAKRTDGVNAVTALLDITQEM